MKMTKKELQQKVLQLEEQIVVEFDKSSEKIELENQVTNLQKELEGLTKLNSEQESKLQDIDKKILTNSTGYNQEMKDKIAKRIEEVSNGK